LLVEKLNHLFALVNNRSDILKILNMNIKLYFYLIVVLVTTISIGNCQITLPYYNSFDLQTDEGWTHYSIQGTDDWQRGVPSGSSLKKSFSGDKVWGTNLSGYFTTNSIMCLQSPDFDMTDTIEYVLSFAHQYNTYYNYQGGNIEYSIDRGHTWKLLNGISNEKVNWIGNSNISFLGQPGWSYNYYPDFKISSHSLGFLSGESTVRFRFKFGGTSNSSEGWVIDDFRIEPASNNIVGVNGEPINVSKHIETFNVTTLINYSGLLNPKDPIQTNYYFSYDGSLDTSDILLGNRTGYISTSTSEWSKTFDMIPNLSYGDYYILCLSG